MDSIHTEQELTMTMLHNKLICMHQRQSMHVLAIDINIHYHNKNSKSEFLIPSPK
jgi:hypothetical protein